MKKAFTLAEVLITLTVIGIVTAVIVPVAIHSKPDENVIKFKKGHNDLYEAIQKLVTSDKYYCMGDLGRQANCTLYVANSDATRDYLCKTMAEVLSAKEVSCIAEGITGDKSAVSLSNNTSEINAILKETRGSQKITVTVNASTIAGAKEFVDAACKKAEAIVGKEITTTDGIVYFQSGDSQLGAHKHEYKDENGDAFIVNFRTFSPPGQFPANIGDQNGYDIMYKIYCMDVDGIPNNITTTKCRNECPFGYGIRADGQILPGARAEEWLAKKIQGE